jgi:hypothetical protein
MGGPGNGTAFEISTRPVVTSNTYRCRPLVSTRTGRCEEGHLLAPTVSRAVFSDLPWRHQPSANLADRMKTGRLDRSSSQ